MGCVFDCVKLGRNNMSHFTVMVKILNEKVKQLSLLTLVRDGESIGFTEAVAEALAPYQENNMNNCPPQFLKFEDVEDDCYNKWQTEEHEMVELPDGQFVWPWDECFRVSGFGFGTNTHKVPDDYKRVMVPSRVRYSTFEQYMEDYHGYKQRDPKTGRYGCWENPNRKWDWYQVGGRWTGQLLLKEEAIINRRGRRGEPSKVVNSLNPEAVNRDPHMADVAMFEDIDFRSMDKAVDDEIEEFYKKVERLRKLESKKRLTKDEKKEKVELDFGARSVLWDIGLVNKDEQGQATSIKDFSVEDLKRDHRHVWEFHSFAVVDEQGQWHEKGEMGWFGCHSGDEKSVINWGLSFKQRFLSDVKPDTWIVMVDCHI